MERSREYLAALNYRITTEDAERLLDALSEPPEKQAAPARRTLTEAEIEDAREAWNRGERLEDLAAGLGVSRRKLRRAIEERR